MDRGPWSLWKVSHLTKNIKNKFYKISHTVEIVTKVDHGPRSTDLFIYFRSLNFVPHTTRAKRAEGTTDASDITATCQALIGSPRMRHISVINRSCIHTHSRGATCRDLIGPCRERLASHPTHPTNPRRSVSIPRVVYVVRVAQCLVISCER